jgi:hypothetical protein
VPEDGLDVEVVALVNLKYFPSVSLEGVKTIRGALQGRESVLAKNLHPELKSEAFLLDVYSSYIHTYCGIFAQSKKYGTRETAVASKRH